MNAIFKHVDMADILEENGTGFFVAGWNMAGYLPDSEPQSFRDFESAREYIANDLEELADDLYSRDTETDEQIADDLMKAREQVEQEEKPFSVSVRGREFWVKENQFSKSELLEQVEEYANYIGISSEEELSEIFDQEVLPAVIEQYGEDDQPAINETFNNWTDSLCKDGFIHDLQYDQYCYVGKLAD